MNLNPQTAAPGTSVAANGKATRRAHARIKAGGIIVVPEFRIGTNGAWAKAFRVPAGPDGAVPITLDTIRADGVWRQTDSATLTRKNPVVTPPIEPPPVPVPTPKPVISGIGVTPNATGAVVEWHVQPPSKGWLKHGLTPAYGSETKHEEGLLDFHRQTIAGYGAGILVNFAVVAEAAGQRSEAPGAFTTVGGVTLPPPKPPAPTNLRVTGTSHTASLVWA